MVRRSDNRDAPLLRTCRSPVVILPGDILQHRLADGVQLSVPVEEADDALGLLKGLNQAVQQDVIEAAVAEPELSR
jgi:hypothetical protein